MKTDSNVKAIYCGDRLAVTDKELHNRMFGGCSEKEVKESMKDFDNAILRLFRKKKDLKEPLDEIDVSTTTKDSNKPSPQLELLTLWGNGLASISISHGVSPNPPDCFGNDIRYGD